MDITINTPALLFPAISLIMLAYTNRFLSLASLVRNLHSKYKDDDKKHVIHGQIKSIKYRLRLIKNMQFLGVASFLFCIFCMYLIYVNQLFFAHIFFALGIICFSFSLVLSLIEIIQSTKALELELSDIEGLEDPTLVEYLKMKLDIE
ncbi:MAG TPA: DUF2721 domain-containing protein [Panacibacter sp.]|nr:DUF2721 domain-containing protein [Panacibacter sp.]